MYAYFQLVMLHERIAEMARLAERRHVAEEQERRDPTPGQGASRDSWAGSLGGSG
jgi:hypothetical protein